MNGHTDKKRSLIYSILFTAAAPLLQSGCGSTDKVKSDNWGPQHAAFVQVQGDAEDFATHYVRTLETGDEEAIRALFVPDNRFAWFTDGVQSYATPDDVLQGMRHYAGIRFQTTLDDVRATPLNVSQASVSTAFQTTLTMSGDKNHEYGGVITLLIEKCPSSESWRIISGHTSTPGGPPQQNQNSQTAS